MKYRFLDYGLLIAFLLLDLSKSALLSWSHSNKGERERPLDFNVIFTKDTLSLSVSAIVCGVTYGGRLVGILWQSRILFLQYIPISLIFLASQNAAFKALQILDIGTFKLFIQGCTPLTAVLSVLLLKKRYTKKEILAIIAVFLFSIFFYVVKSSSVSDHLISLVDTGVTYSILVTVLSSLGGVVSEKALKSNPESLGLQFCYSRLAAVCISATIYLFMPVEETHKEFFAFFDARTIIVIFQFALSGFLVATITKRLSSTAKNVTQAASAGVAQIVTMVSIDWMHTNIKSVAATNTNPLAGLCAVGIVGSVVYFHVSSSGSKTVEHDEEAPQMQNEKE